VKTNQESIPALQESEGQNRGKIPEWTKKKRGAEDKNEDLDHNSSGRLWKKQRYKTRERSAKKKNTPSRGRKGPFPIIKSKWGKSRWISRPFKKSLSQWVQGDRRDERGLTPI